MKPVVGIRHTTGMFHLGIHIGITMLQCIAP